MLTLITAIPGKLKLWFSIAGAVIVAVAIAYMRGRSAGSDAAEAAELKRRQAAMKQARKIEDEIACLSDDELDRRLSRWIRK
jgi:hypothetical protein